LDLVADSNAHAATDAEVHVKANEVRFIIYMKIPRFRRERRLCNLEFSNQILKVTCPGRITRRAQQRVGPQKQHELLTPGFGKLGAVGSHFHAVARGIETRRHGTGTASTGNLHHAEATCSIWHKPLVITEGRDANSCLLRGFQNGSSSFYSNFNTVNGKGLHRNYLTTSDFDWAL